MKLEKGYEGSVIEKHISPAAGRQKINDIKKEGYIKVT